MQYTWQLALVLVYFIKHSVSCYIYYIHAQYIKKVYLQYTCMYMYNAHTIDLPKETMTLYVHVQCSHY